MSIDTDKRPVQAIALAKVLNMQDIGEAMLAFPCPHCKAKAGKPCHTINNPNRKASTHSNRGAILWAMWHKGYKAGRDRALAEAAEAS